MSSQNIFIKIFLPSGTFSDFHLGESMEGVQSRRKNTATATGSAARVASDAIFSGRNFCVTCDPCGTVRDVTATLTPRKGETTNDQNRTTCIRIVALCLPPRRWQDACPLSAGQAERLDSHRQRRLEPNAFYWGQKPRAKALPTYLFFAERKGKPKETNTMISIFKEVIL